MEGEARCHRELRGRAEPGMGVDMGRGSSGSRLAGREGELGGRERRLTGWAPAAEVVNTTVRLKAKLGGHGAWPPLREAGEQLAASRAKRRAELHQRRAGGRRRGRQIGDVEHGCACVPVCACVCLVCALCVRAWTCGCVDAWMSG